MSPFLHSLNQEYKDLKRKLQKVTDLITEYNGDLIEEVTSPSETSTAISEEDTVVDRVRLPQQSLKSLEESISTTIDNLIESSQQVQIPIFTNEHFTTSTKPIVNNTLSNVAPLSFEYPTQGTWKDKIIYALRVSGHPSKAADIASFLQRFEPSEKAARVLSMTRQYCCNLGQDGHLGVQSVGRANLYFLKQ